MLVSNEIRNNLRLYNKLMSLSEKDASKVPIIINNDKTKLYAEGVLQGIDVMFYLMQELGMSDGALHEMIRRTKGYFEAF